MRPDQARGSIIESDIDKVRKLQFDLNKLRVKLDKINAELKKAETDLRKLSNQKPGKVEAAQAAQAAQAGVNEYKEKQSALLSEIGELKNEIKKSVDKIVKDREARAKIKKSGTEVKREQTEVKNPPVQAPKSSAAKHNITAQRRPTVEINELRKTMKKQEQQLHKTLTFGKRS